MSEKTCYEDTLEQISSIKRILALGTQDKSFWTSRLDELMKDKCLYESHELEERPLAMYADWLIQFSDDNHMMDFFENEAFELADVFDDENPLDAILSGVSIEYVLLTGVELGQLGILER